MILQVFSSFFVAELHYFNLAILADAHTCLYDDIIDDFLNHVNRLTVHHLTEKLVSRI